VCCAGPELRVDVVMECWTRSHRAISKRCPRNVCDAQDVVCPTQMRQTMGDKKLFLRCLVLDGMVRWIPQLARMRVVGRKERGKEKQRGLCQKWDWDWRRGTDRQVPNCIVPQAGASKVGWEGINQQNGGG
jgi:hypothetical protein